MLIPSFTDVYIKNPDGSQTKLNPELCATDECAKNLAEILKDLAPKIIAKYPTPSGNQLYNNQFQITSTVPWFEFSDGTQINVGTVAAYWIRFVGPASERWARREIAQASYEQGYGPRPF